MIKTTTTDQRYQRLVEIRCAGLKHNGNQSSMAELRRIERAMAHAEKTGTELRACMTQFGVNNDQIEPPISLNSRYS